MVDHFEAFVLYKRSKIQLRDLNASKIIYMSSNVCSKETRVYKILLHSFLDLGVFYFVQNIEKEEISFFYLDNGDL